MQSRPEGSGFGRRGWESQPADYPQRRRGDFMSGEPPQPKRYRQDGPPGPPSPGGYHRQRADNRALNDNRRPGSLSDGPSRGPSREYYDAEYYDDVAAGPFPPGPSYNHAPYSPLHMRPNAPQHFPPDYGPHRQPPNMLTGPQGGGSGMGPGGAGGPYGNPIGRPNMDVVDMQWPPYPVDGMAPHDPPRMPPPMPGLGPPPVFAQLAGPIGPLGSLSAPAPLPSPTPLGGALSLPPSSFSLPANSPLLSAGPPASAPVPIRSAGHLPQPPLPPPAHAPAQQPLDNSLGLVPPVSFPVATLGPPPGGPPAAPPPLLSLPPVSAALAAPYPPLPSPAAPPAPMPASSAALPTTPLWPLMTAPPATSTGSGGASTSTAELGQNVLSMLLSKLSSTSRAAASPSDASTQVRPPAAVVNTSAAAPRPLQTESQTAAWSAASKADALRTLLQTVTQQLSAAAPTATSQSSARLPATSSPPVPSAPSTSSGLANLDATTLTALTALLAGSASAASQPRPPPLPSFAPPTATPHDATHQLLISLAPLNNPLPPLPPPLAPSAPSALVIAAPAPPTPMVDTLDAALAGLNPPVDFLAALAATPQGKAALLAALSAAPVTPAASPFGGVGMDAPLLWGPLSAPPPHTNHLQHVFPGAPALPSPQPSNSGLAGPWRGSSPAQWANLENSRLSAPLSSSPPPGTAFNTRPPPSHGQPMYGPLGAAPRSGAAARGSPAEVSMRSGSYHRRGPGGAPQHAPPAQVNRR